MEADQGGSIDDNEGHFFEDASVAGDSVLDSADYPQFRQGSPSSAMAAAIKRPTRRRAQHNEMEKKRREHQRVRLDELRACIPGIESSKASMIHIIVKAREYIQYLQSKLVEAERLLAQNQGSMGISTAQARSHYPVLLPQHPGMPDSGSFFAQTMPQLSTTQISPPRKLKRMRSKLIVPGMKSSSKSPSFSTTSEDDVMLPESFRKPSELFPQRRDSSLLLPSNDPHTFYFGQRDSLQSIFAHMAALAPEGHQITDPNAQQGCSLLQFSTIATAASSSLVSTSSSDLNIACGKCGRGVENMIMIDCDQCSRWYHIRCVSIDNTNIPVRWKCGECAPTIKTS